MPYKVLSWAKLAVTFVLLSAATAWADWSAINMTPGVTDISREVYGLHMIIFWICVVIGVLVFGVMFYSIFAHRKSRGVKPAEFHESTLTEVIWTVVPFLILIAMAVPATKTLIKIYDSADSAVDIKITGYQWRWQYDYLNDDFAYFSNMSTTQDAIYNRAPKGENYLLEVDEPMMVPINQKIRFLITANDVIHSWWVPDLAVKKDAIPGFINESWTVINEPGIYRGQCTELCGKDHGFMPVVVRAVEQEEYDAWVAEKKAEAERERELRNTVLTMEQLMERGQSVYGRFCAACHNADGTGILPAFPPLKGTAIATTAPISEHMDMVIHGVPGTFMAAFGPQLSEVDLAAVITYERNAWGHDTGDMVQPIDIAEFMAAQ